MARKPTKKAPQNATRKPAKKPGKKSGKTPGKKAVQTLSSTTAPTHSARRKAQPKSAPHPMPKAKPAAPAKPRPSHTPLKPAKADAGSPKPDTPAVSKPTRSISSESVQNATGKTKDEWFSILDALQADKLAHKDIAKFLAAEHGLGSWWSQTVTVEYELARGLRQPNESSTGGFQVSVSKTINASIERLDKAWSFADKRSRWLGDYPIEIRVAHTQKDMRLTWLSPDNAEGSHVDVAFTPKDGGRRSMVSVQHRKLSGPEDVAWARSFWSIKLEALRSALEK